MLNHGVWVVGFVVDPVHHHSMMTGWGNEFEAMKKEYPTQITQQLRDMEVLMGGEHIKAQIRSAISPALQHLAFEASQIKDRDGERKIFPKILLYDIGWWSSY
jgi:hypothetical protein